MSFTKNSTHLLRGMSVTVRPDGTLKASEPSQKGTHLFMAPSGDKLEAACQAYVITEAGSGEAWCDLYALHQTVGADEPMARNVRVNRNKIVGDEAGVKYVTGRRPSSSGAPVQAKVAPSDPLALYAEAVKKVEAAQLALENARKELAARKVVLQQIAAVAAALEIDEDSDSGESVAVEA